jgi:hypothetical protein
MATTQHTWIPRRINGEVRLQTLAAPLLDGKHLQAQFDQEAFSLSDSPRQTLEQSE